MNNWYASLNRPPLTPPSWIFSPVWTILYVMIAVAIFLYYRTPAKSHGRLTTSVLIVHLAANFSWTWLFFGQQAPGLAFIDIVILDFTLVLLICAFWKTRQLAGALLLPYLGWVLFATYLNAGFYWLN